MAILFTSAIIGFFISLVISSLIIYFITKMFGESEGFGTAILAALIGSLIYAVAYALLGGGFWAALLGGLAWLFALRVMYKIGWLRSLGVALVIWLTAAIVSWILPTMLGPL